MQSPFDQKSLPPMTETDWAILELQRLADWARRQSTLHTGGTLARYVGLAQGYEESVRVIRELRGKKPEAY